MVAGGMGLGGRVLVSEESLWTECLEGHKVLCGGVAVDKLSINVEREEVKSVVEEDRSARCGGEKENGGERGGERDREGEKPAGTAAQTEACKVPLGFSFLPDLFSDRSLGSSHP